MPRFTPAIAFVFALAGFSFSAPVLDSLAIEGLSLNPPRVVENALTVRLGQTFTAADLQSSIRSLYRTGFFSNVAVDLVNETDSTAAILVTVTENLLCDNVEFKGLKRIKEAEIREKIAMKKGRPISKTALFDDVQLIRKEYEKEGYLLADVKVDLVETKVPGYQIARFSVAEGKKVRVSSVTFVGNKAFSARRLRAKFKTNQHRFIIPGEFKEDAYRGHLDTLMTWYHDQGWLDAHVVNDSVNSRGRNLDIRITIDEGRRCYTGDFYFVDNKVLDKTALQSRIALKRGKPFAKNKFEMSKGFIANAYREEGYLWVNLDESNRYRGDTIDVTFAVSEGRPAIVRRVEIEGNQKTREKVIRRELSVYPGQKYRQSRMERSIRDAMQLNYFNAVNPDIRPAGTEDGTIDLVFKTDEKENIGQFSAGVSYSQIDKFGGNFSISIPNFRGAGEQLATNIEFSRYRQAGSFSFTEPWIFDSPTSLTVSPFWQHSTNSSKTYDVTSYGLQVSAGRKLTWPDDYWYGSLGYRISKEDDAVRNPYNIHGFSILQSGILSRADISLSRSDVDLPQFSTRGSRFGLNSSFAGLGGDYKFIKSTMTYDMYFPLFWKLVFGVKSKFGTIAPFGDVKLAATDLFAVGGVYYDGIVRGYEEGQFGRYDNYKGRNMAAFSAELRVPILDQQLYVAAFADMGNAWDKAEDIDIAKMYRGVGAGFRLMLPMIGLLGFDFGWALDDVNQTSITSKKKLKGSPNPHFIMSKDF